MTTELLDPKVSVEAVPLSDDTYPVIGAVTSTPSKNISSETFLQQQVFTGYQVKVPLPFGAEHGFEPMFAFRVQGFMNTPHIYADASNLTEFYKSSGDVNYATSLPQADKDKMPIRPYGACTATITGPEPPQSIFTRSYRYNRLDIVYTLRIVSTYTGGGILMIVPVKGVPRGSGPLVSGSLAQVVANGMQFNSNIQCDLSKSRQMRFVYPYEYPTEFQDFQEDMFDETAYTTYTVKSSMPRAFDNWFLVGTRGSIITPTNADSLTFYVDYAFASHQLLTPLLPSFRTVYPVVPLITDGTKTLACVLERSDFSDYAIYTGSTTVQNKTGADLNYVGNSNHSVLDGVHVLSNNATMVIPSGGYLSVFIDKAAVTKDQRPTFIRMNCIYLAMPTTLKLDRGSTAITVSTDYKSPTFLTPSATYYTITAA